MTTRNPLRPLVLVLMAFVLLVAACGDDDSTVDSGDDTGAETGDLLPLDDSPASAGACLEGAVDCQDTGVDFDPPEFEPGDTPPPGEPVSSGALANGGLSVDEALGMTPSDGIIAVSGALFQDDTGTYLCEALAESLPPQCGKELRLEGFDFEMLGVPLQSAQGISWTDAPVSVFGTIDGGVLMVDSTVAG